LIAPITAPCSVTKTFILLAFLSAPLFLGSTEVSATPNGMLPLETFEEYSLLTFPELWKVRGDQDEAQTIYRVMEEGGNRFLHAQAQHQAIQIGLPQVFSPQEFPLLCWRWRISQLPPEGDERRKETHDSAAGVYVIFDNPIFPRIIKYVWSSTVPVGTRLQNPLYWRAQMVVVESGPSGLGEWRPETVNFYQDYKTLFGVEPGKVLGIGLMTSSSFTKSVAIADYDDFLLLERDTLPAAPFPPPPVGLGSVPVVLSR
jgi:hypothetical protein